jgi:hypothetical protein
MSSRRLYVCRFTLSLTLSVINTHSCASHLAEHPPKPLDGLAAHRAAMVNLQELLGARLARARVQARQHGVLLGRVEAHHAHRLL